MAIWRIIKRALGGDPSPPAGRQTEQDAALSSLSWEEASERLVAVVRAPSMFLDSDGVVPFMHRPFVPGLVEAVLIDAGGGARYVTAEDAAHWGKRDEEIFARAREILAGQQHDIAPHPDADSPLLRVDRGDADGSACLLLPGFLERFRERVEGEPVAIIPDWKLMLVGGTAGDGVVERLLELAEHELQASPRYLSPALYATGPEGSVVPWAPPLGEPGHEQAAIARLRVIGGEYMAQKAALDEELAEEGIDVFVAAFDAIKSDDGVVRSHAVWTHDIETWLPRTDDLALLRPDEDGGVDWELVVPWDLAMEHLGQWLQPVPDVHPPRYETLGWPSEEAIEEVRTLLESAET